MANYQVFHCTERGYSHILKNTCCEDASLSFSQGDIHAAVVSDGHGDPACFRSHIGSRLAAEIAGEKLLSFAQNIRKMGWEEQLLDPSRQEPILRQLIRSIIGNWNMQIAQQLQEQPVTEEEYAVSGSYEARYRNGQALSHIFGCTLIALLVTDRYLLALQQGDGRCVVIHCNGTADQPVPWDDRCVGNICTSLCHEDAVESCRYYVADLRRDPIAACFALSDGIEDSLDSCEDVNAFVGNAVCILRQDGKELLLDQLREYLPRMSQNGSADDMSLAGIVDADIVDDLVRWLELMYILSNQETMLRKAMSKVNSMQRKHDSLQEAMEKARAEYDQVNEELSEKLSLLERLKLELRRTIHARDEQVLLLESVKKKMKAAEESYREYHEKRQTYIENALAAEKDISETREALAALSGQLPVIEEAQPEQPDWELPETLNWEDEQDEPVEKSEEKEPDSREDEEDC